MYPYLRNSVTIFFLALILLNTGGCQHDPMFDGDGDRQVVVFLSTQSLSSSLLKSLATNDEKGIDDVLLFGIDGESNVVDTFYRVNPSSSGIELTVPSEIKSFYAIANPTVGMKAESKLTVPTVSDIMDLVADFSSAPESPFLMSGKGNVTKYSASIPLYFAFAKVEIIPEGEGFEITSVTAINTPEQAYVFGRGSLSVPDESVTDYDPVYPVPSKPLIVYVAENSGETPTQFVVNGTFESKTIQDTIELKQGKQNIDILRNIHYRVSIKPVGEKLGQITVTIADWNDVITEPHVITDDDPDPYKNGINILSIGNSFSHNAMHYLPDLLEQLGVDTAKNGNINVVIAFRGSSSLNDHAGWALGNTNIYQKITFNRINGDYLPYWPAATHTLKQIIDDVQWDVITLQQLSDFAGDPNTYNQDLDYLVGYLQSNANGGSGGYKLGWHMTWTWADACSDYSTYYGNQSTMYAATCSAVQNKIKTKDEGGPFDFIIPVGTAIQNARAKGMQGVLLSGPNPPDLCYDNIHLNGLGCYIAAATWAKAITGYDLSELVNNYYCGRVITAAGSAPNYTPSYTPSTGWYQIGVTSSDPQERNKVIQAVNDAVTTPFSVTP